MVAASSTRQRLATTARAPAAWKAALEAHYTLTVLERAQAGLAGGEDDQLGTPQIQGLHLLGRQDPVLARRRIGGGIGQPGARFAAAAGQHDPGAQQGRQGEVLIILSRLGGLEGQGQRILATNRGAEGRDPGGGLEEAVRPQVHHPPVAAVEPLLDRGLGRLGSDQQLGRLASEGGVEQLAGTTGLGAGPR